MYVVVGSDFHPEFLDWLFDTAQRLIAPPARERDISPPRERERERERERSPIRSRRLLDSALGGLGSNNKRKSDVDGGSQNKRRISEGTSNGPISAPGAPRAMMGNEGRGLADRMGPRRGGGAGGMVVRGMGRGGMGGKSLRYISLKKVTDV
jgi:hypothetical protein